MLSTLYSYLARHVGPERFFRGKLLLSILLVLNALNALSFLYFFFVAGLVMDDSARAWSLQLIGATQLFYVVLLLALLRGHFHAAATGTMVTVTAAPLVAVGLTGGVPLSPAMAFLMVPAVLGFCILGPRGGLIMASLVLAVCGTQWYLTSNGMLELPALQSQSNPDKDALLINTVNYMVIIFVLFMYERISTRLRNERDAERQRLAHFATHDDLTGLANRRHFSQRLHEACAQCARDGHQIAVVYLDLNGFKTINDTLGHEAGDRTLQLVARRLATTLRTQDLVARIGGDEFAIIINPCNARGEITELCLRLQAAVSEPFTLNGTQLTVSASIGTAFYPGESDSVDQVLKMADIEMYAQKQRQRSSLEQ